MMMTPDTAGGVGTIYKLPDDSEQQKLVTEDDRVPQNRVTTYVKQQMMDTRDTQMQPCQIGGLACPLDVGSNC